MVIYCVLIVFIITICFKQADFLNNNAKKTKVNKYTIIGIVIFSLWVGFRYNPEVDQDFMNYWDIGKYGENFYEYQRFEFFPQRFADLVQLFHLSPSWFMVFMGLALISFTVFAATRLHRSYVAYVFVGFILFYLKFDMNGMRQGVAMSAFLCALTYIKERNWKFYLLFMLIAFGFHRSSIIWSPIYFLTYLNWKQHNKRLFIMLIISMVIVVTFLLWFIQHFAFVFELMNMERKVASGDVDLLEYNSVSSGVGVILNYVRWFFLLLYIPKLARISRDSGIFMYLGIFLMGAVLYTFGKESIYIGRVALYPQIAELLLYPYLYDYSKKHLIKDKILKPMILLQVLAFTYAAGDYFSNWRFIGM